jgi:hypothetical protein
MQEPHNNSPCSSSETIQEELYPIKTSGPREEWLISHQVQELQERTGSRADKPKRLGVTWSNLTVKGVSQDATFNENVLSQFVPSFRRDKKPPLKTIIDNSFGCVKPGGTYSDHY